MHIQVGIEVPRSPSRRIVVPQVRLCSNVTPRSGASVNTQGCTKDCLHQKARRCWYWEDGSRKVDRLHKPAIRKFQQSIPQPSKKLLHWSVSYRGILRRIEDYPILGILAFLAFRDVSSRLEHAGSYQSCVEASLAPLDPAGCHTLHTGSWLAWSLGTLRLLSSGRKLCPEMPELFCNIPKQEAIVLTRCPPRGDLGDALVLAWIALKFRSRSSAPHWAPWKSPDPFLKVVGKQNAAPHLSSPCRNRVWEIHAKLRATSHHDYHALLKATNYELCRAPHAASLNRRSSFHILKTKEKIYAVCVAGPSVLHYFTSTCRAGPLESSIMAFFQPHAPASHAKRPSTYGFATCGL